MIFGKALTGPMKRIEKEFETWKPASNHANCCIHIIISQRRKRFALNLLEMADWNAEKTNVKSLHVSNWTIRLCCPYYSFLLSMFVVACLSYVKIRGWSDKNDFRLALTFLLAERKFVPWFAQMKRIKLYRSAMVVCDNQASDVITQFRKRRRSEGAKGASDCGPKQSPRIMQLNRILLLT